MLQSFYRLEDGLFLAFFKTRSPFDLKIQRDFDLHNALEVSADYLQDMKAKGEAAGFKPGECQITGL